MDKDAIERQEIIIKDITNRMEAMLDKAYADYKQQGREGIECANGTLNALINCTVGFYCNFLTKIGYDKPAIYGAAADHFVGTLEKALGLAKKEVVVEDDEDEH